MPGQPAGDGEHRGDHRAAGAERLDAAVVPRRPNAKRGFQRGDPAFAEAAEVAAAGVGRQAIDVVDRQAGVGDRGLAGRDGQRQRWHHQPPPDFRHADSGERHLVFEFLRGQHRPHELSEPLRFDLVDRQRRGFCVCDETEQRQPDVLVLLEDDLHLLAQFKLFGIAVDDVGGQSNSRILRDGDLGDDVGGG
jgi:hypothetical protein